MTHAVAGGAADTAPITFDASRCVRAFDKYATCDRCVASCPTTALSGNGSLAFNASACVDCGLCLHLCPLGAFAGHDDVTQLLTCASRLGRPQQLELACARHPSPSKGPHESEAVIVLDGCLAALGASVYLALLAQSSARLLVRLDACADCPLGKARLGIEQTLAVAHALGGAVESLPHGAGDEWQVRPVIQASQPPLSRRDFLRTFAAQGQVLLAQALSAGDESETAAKRPPRERRRLLNALRLGPVRAEHHVDAPPFGSVAVNDACSACGACARACPTGALQFSQTDRSFRVSFAAAYCTACGACADVCEPKALRQERGVSLNALLTVRSVVVCEGALHACVRCGAKFASATESHLCPICDFRQRNPFGSRVPAGMGRGRG
ncbi:MAG: 4Fe-4S binding protein [Chloroflexi bacterium]|nr:4Fe-4S binding protein [Chloroflexota bacterium]